MTDSVIIVSGGMDSVTLLHYLVKEEHKNPMILSFLYGQKHSRELGCAQKHSAILGCKPPVVIDLSAMKNIFNSSALVSSSIEIPKMRDVKGSPQPETYVPNRNMIFLALAVAQAETCNVSDVYYGAQSHDMYGYWDTTIEFLESVNNVYRLNRGNKIRIHAPFVHCSKTDILKLGLELGVDYGRTWSCYKGGEKACGECPTCVERLNAFSNIGISDPLEYEV